jgi:hypothetical protein
MYAPNTIKKDPQIMPFSFIEYPKEIVPAPSVVATKVNTLPEVPPGLKFL